MEEKEKTGDSKSKKIILGERLRKLRRDRNWTQEHVASTLSIVRSTYTYYETGKTFPDYVTIIRMSKLFSVTIDYLLGQEQESLVLRDDLTPKYSTNEENGIKTAVGISPGVNTPEQRLIAAFHYLPLSEQRRLLAEVEYLAMIEHEGRRNGNSGNETK